jgi:hypothetical protein
VLIEATIRHVAAHCHDATAFNIAEIGAQARAGRTEAAD